MKTFPVVLDLMLRKTASVVGLLLSRRVILLQLFASLICQAWSAERIVYCDSNAVGPGDGTIGNPYRALGLLPWTKVGGWVTAGDSVSIFLKCGSVFRETLTVGASGVLGRPIVFADYGEGPQPRIYGDKAFLGWTPSPSSPERVWQASDPNGAFFVWTNDVLLFKGTDVNTLRPGEWFSANGTLSYRSDAGDPGLLGLEVRGAIRPYAIVINTNYLTFRNLVLGYTRNQAIRILAGQGLIFEGCTMVASPECAWVGNASAVFQTCRFINGQLTVDNPAATVRLLYCLLQHDPEYRYIRNLNVINAASVVCLNGAIVGGNRNQVFKAGAGTLGFTNCIFAAHGSDLDANGDPVIQSTTGLCVVAHCCLLPSGRSTSFLTGVTLGPGNLFLGPKFRNYARDGILMPIIDDYENRFAWDTISQKADIYGYRTTLAVSQTPFLDSQAKALIRTRIAGGHGIASHTRSHAELGTVLAFTLRYVGAGDSCSLSVTGSRLRTVIANDTNGDGLDVDLGRFALDEIGPSDALIKYLDDLPNYECRSGRYPIQNYNHRVPLRFLFPVEVSDIKPGPGSVFYDTNAWYNYEIVGSKTDLESAFPEVGDILGLVYASSGYITNSELKAIGYPIQLNAGYRYGRTVNLAGNWVRTRMNLFEASVGKSLVPPICELQFESNCSDILAGRHFTGANISYVASGDTTGAKAAWFNGSSSVVTRTNDPAWDYSWRDWMFRAKIRPQTFDRDQTLWFHGRDASNHLRIFLTGDRRLAFEVIEQGDTRLALQTQSELLATNQTQSVAVQQIHDRWSLWVGNEMAAATTNLFTMQVPDGPLLLGCSAITGAGVTGNYYGGLMDDVVWVVLGYAQTAAIAETVGFSGGALSIYGHNETYVPSELWRLAFQAWSESGANLNVTNVNGAINRLLASGSFDPGAYLLSSAWHGTNDFRLRPDSPCVDTADPAAVLGVPGLRDLAGHPITDDLGNLLVPYLDIGPYESAFDRAMLPILTIARLEGDLLQLRLPAEGRTSCLFEVTSDLRNWLPIRTNTAPTNGFYECYESNARLPNTFYRARLNAND